MRADVIRSDAIVAIKDNGGNSYSFTMPKGDVTVWIYIEYQAPQDKTLYSIGYDSLGWAGIEVVNFICPDKAVAGETVTIRRFHLLGYGRKGRQGKPRNNSRTAQKQLIKTGVIIGFKRLSARRGLR